MISKKMYYLILIFVIYAVTVKTAENNINMDKIEEKICPICNTHVNEFSLCGSKFKRKGLCKKCQSKERHRHLYLFLEKYKDLLFNQNEKQVLHWAPEQCIKTTLLKYQINYTGADLSPKNKSIKKLNITNITLPNESIDIIVCSHVLEHVIEDKKAMQECYRVLKSDAWAIFIVPIYSALKTTFEDKSIVSKKDRQFWFDQKDHVRKYGLDFKNKLENSGFKVTIFPVESLDKKIAEKYGITSKYDSFLKMADIYFCAKDLNYFK